MTDIKGTDVITKMIELLGPLSTEERRRIVGACLTFLGDNAANLNPTSPNARQQISEETAALPPRARAWINQNNISMDELLQVFHVENGRAEVIATQMPGKSDKEKTYSAYVLTGIGKLLATGSPAFDDKSARSLCISSGCFTGGNHATHLKEKGNEFTGSKEKGWTLTNPGLARGAALIRELRKH